MILDSESLALSKPPKFLFFSLIPEILPNVPLSYVNLHNNRNSLNERDFCSSNSLFEKYNQNTIKVHNNLQII